ncbi:MAG: toll/interleukin-1 receptor domain-containing protein, partial [Candidatus Rokuibacteriota bacterium]
MGRINVFYSYAHKDVAYRERLVAWLDALREEGVVSDWHDRKIVPGADWAREIADNLERSHIVLFLISPAFMASDYSIGVEVKKAIELH